MPIQIFFCEKCANEVYGKMDCPYCGSKPVIRTIKKMSEFKSNILFCKNCKSGIDASLTVCPNCGQRRKKNEGKNIFYDSESLGYSFLKFTLWSLFLAFVFIYIIDGGCRGFKSDAIKVRLSY